MKAYHLKMSEAQVPEITGGLFESRFPVDTIYVPKKKVLVGFVNHDGEKCGYIVNYTEEYYTERKPWAEVRIVNYNEAKTVIKGSKDALGKIISEIDIDENTIEKIIKYAKIKHEKNMTLNNEFDYSTDSLIRVLLGEATVESKPKKSLFAKIFSH